MAAILEIPTEKTDAMKLHWISLKEIENFDGGSCLTGYFVGLILGCHVPKTECNFGIDLDCPEYLK